MIGGALFDVVDAARRLLGAKVELEVDPGGGDQVAPLQVRFLETRVHDHDHPRGGLRIPLAIQATDRRVVVRANGDADVGWNLPVRPADQGGNQRARHRAQR